VGQKIHNLVAFMWLCLYTNISSRHRAALTWLAKEALRLKILQHTIKLAMQFKNRE